MSRIYSKHKVLILAHSFKSFPLMIGRAWWSSCQQQYEIVYSHFGGLGNRPWDLKKDQLQYDTLMFPRALHFVSKTLLSFLKHHIGHGTKYSKACTCARAFHIPATTKHLKLFSLVLRTDFRVRKEARKI